jgi:type IV secretory pathway component VirB8
MSTAHALPPPPREFETGRRAYLELYAKKAVDNTHLTIAVVSLAVVSVVLAFACLHLYQKSRTPERIIVWIDDLGRPEVTRQAGGAFQPREADIKYFLIQFVQQHYGRMRATAKENWSRSLYFLDGRLADAVMEADRKTRAMETFLAGHAEEIDVEIKSVSIEDLRSPPYRATVAYEKVYYGAGRTETRREKYIGNFVFTVRDSVPNAMIPINPLGFTISYFREDQAFE